MTTSRGAFKVIFFSIITVGIYYLVFLSHLNRDVNTCYEGEQQQHGLFVAFLLGLVTLGIYTLVWDIKLLNRIYNKAIAEHLETHGSVAFFIISILLLFWTVVCPIIALSGLCKTANEICANYNEKHSVVQA